MPNIDNASALKLRIILAALETDTQELADALGEQRPVLSGIISGQRKAKRARRKLAEAVNQKINDLILTEDAVTQ